MLIGAPGSIQRPAPHTLQPAQFATRTRWLKPPSLLAAGVAAAAGLSDTDDMLLVDEERDSGPRQVDSWHQQRQVNIDVIIPTLFCTLKLRYKV